jgi:hypothetical protein
MRHIQNISFQKARDISDKDNLAEQLSNISKENPAMLARNTEFYEDLLFKNLFVVAKDLATNKIV